MNRRQALAAGTAVVFSGCSGVLPSRSPADTIITKLLVENLRSTDELTLSVRVLDDERQVLFEKAVELDPAPDGSDGDVFDDDIGPAPELTVEARRVGAPADPTHPEYAETTLTSGCWQISADNRFDTGVAIFRAGGCPGGTDTDSKLAHDGR